MIPKNVHNLEQLAPRPTRRSKARALYDAVQSSGGAATLPEIMELLPATDDASKWSTMTPQRIGADLYPVMKQGYLVHDDFTGTWKIAPRDYYDAVREEKNAQHARSQAKMAKSQAAIDGDVPMIAPIEVRVEAPDDYFRISKGAVLFLLLLGSGVCAGVLGTLLYQQLF